MQKTKEQYFKEFEERMAQKEMGISEEVVLPDFLQDFISKLSIDAVLEEYENEEVEDLEVVVAREERRKQEERELLAKEIVKQQTKEDARLYNKEDIMSIFKCESDKALRILRLAYQMKYATKIGKEYYMSKEDFKSFLEQIKGRNTII